MSAVAPAVDNNPLEATEGTEISGEGVEDGSRRVL